MLLTEAVGFYEYVRDVEQDFVKKIDLEDAKVKMQEFASKGAARCGLERIEAIFQADNIGQSVLRVLIPDRQETVKIPNTSPPKLATQVDTVQDEERKYRSQTRVTV